MVYWNYRIMKRNNSEGQFEFGIYEVHYGDNYNIEGWTENPLTPAHESVESLNSELTRMMTALEKETLTYEED